MKKISFTSCELDRVPFVEWEDYDEMRKENIYWEGLLPICLTPDDKSYESTTFGQKKLRNLRMTVLWVFGVSNTLWIILVLTLFVHRDQENLGLDLISFLIVCGGIFVVQFLALLCHRVQALVFFCHVHLGLEIIEKMRKNKRKHGKMILDGGKIGKRVLYPMLNFLVVIYFKKIDLTSCAVQEKVVSH